ncbi:unnamed protein product [Eruca vesicaria subsp. sativa]|uniref:DC1 domain-containing protein n=1 Tax=Eruca vesicaria subsp. sativa TaxID=29727 RepID=A0ABC8JIR9_ERUVS|nr:unnamed protein product [Eruca vesicaria subsp. sativa]
MNDTFDVDFALATHAVSDMCVVGLPYKVKYEHDEHMLNLSYEKNATGPWWCQICEETTYPKKCYYACNECGVTFHAECLLGDDIDNICSYETSLRSFLPTDLADLSVMVVKTAVNTRLN